MNTIAAAVAVPPVLNRVGALAGPLAAGLARGACLLVACYMVWGGITNPMGRQVLWIAAGLVFLFLVAWALAARQHGAAAEAGWNRAGLVILVLACLIGFGWALAFDSNQSSDFGIYYRCGTSFRPGLYAWMESCRSNYFYQPDYTYWSRALVYSAPFGAVFGDNYPAFKLYNATLHAATMAVLFFGIRGLAGPRPAVVALLLLALYPEWFFSITVATPDNLAVLLIVAFLVLVPRAARAEGTTGWLLACALGALAFLAHLARTVGPFLLLALVLTFLVVQDRRHWKRTMLHAAIAVLVYAAANAAFGAFVGKPVQGQFALLQRISTIDLREPLQNYRLVFGWLDQFLPVVPDALREKVTARRIVTEFAQGFSSYPEYLLAKVRVFSEGSGYYLYSTTDAGANPDSARTAAAFTVPTHPRMVVILGAIVPALAFLTLVALLRGKRGTLADVCAFFMATICLVILGFGDTQQRYSLLIAPSMAIMVALALFPSREAAAAPARRALQPDALWTLAGLAAIVLVYLACKPVAAAVAIRMPSPLANARQESSPTPCNPGPVTLQGDYKRLRALPPAGASCFAISVPLPPAARSVSFFLSRDEFPFPFEPRTPAPYRVSVEQDGKVLLAADLGRDIVRWHQVDLARPAAAGERLRFVVQSTQAGSSEPFNVWWLTSSSRPLQ